MRRRDPIENEMELALSPGVFIRDRACFSFVSGLEAVACGIDSLLETEAERAAGLFETFLAGCHEKAEELDDSSGSFSQFARDLICRWIKARQAFDANPRETAGRLLEWMDSDAHAFCYQIEKDVAKTFDKGGLAAFESLIRARFETTLPDERYERRRWGDALRAIYLEQRNPAAYQTFAEQAGLSPEDCLAMATILKQKPALALSWVERGIDLDRGSAHSSAAHYDLSRLYRELLTKLGRREEAVDAAWAEYREHPSKSAHDDLMKVVPKSERAAWHEKALNAAKGTDLHSEMELLVETRETERLADLVRGTADLVLENLSHYTTEPAARMIEKVHPGAAARLWRAQALRIVAAGKSKYYDAAAANLDRARKCYSRAGLADEWEETVRQVRADHYRKTAFMALFEPVASGTRFQERPSFLDRAKARWSRSGGKDRL